MNKLQHKNLPPQVFNLKGWIELVDENTIQTLFTDTLEKSGFSILNYASHQFPVNGFTAFWLLAESHLALHTFTESGWCYIELTSCNKSKSETFMQLTQSNSFNVRWDNDLTVSHAVCNNIPILTSL